jgi:hypothetical protein
MRGFGVQTALEQFMSGFREAMTIWLVLVACVAAVCLVPVLRRRPAPKRKVALRPAVEQRRAAQKRLADNRAAELERYADEVAVAARRAGVMAERTQVECVAAQRTRESAWRVYEEAQQAVHRVCRADAFGVPQGPPTVDELRLRGLHLHRAARQAYDTGQLSGAQLAEILMRRGHWDPDTHPFVQETLLRRATRDRLLRAYREAAKVEARAIHAADVAAAAERSLAAEARTAAVRTAQAKSAVDRPARWTWAQRLRETTQAIPRPT